MPSPTVCIVSKILPLLQCTWLPESLVALRSPSVSIREFKLQVMCACRFICKLAFTRPKAGRKVESLNWAQEHKNVWDGPASKATGHAARAQLARADVRTGVRADRRPLRSPALVARAVFLKIGHFAPSSQFLHIKGLHKKMVVYFRAQRYPSFNYANVRKPSMNGSLGARVTCLVVSRDPGRAGPFSDLIGPLKCQA